jgi:carbamoyltransferase
MEKSYYIGINFSHDASVSVCDSQGVLILASEEERLSRIKHNYSEDSLIEGYNSVYYPVLTISRFLKDFNVTTNDIKAIYYSVAVEFDFKDEYREVTDTIFETISSQFGHDFRHCQKIKVSHHMAHFFSAKIFTDAKDVLGVVIDGSGNRLFVNSDLRYYWERTSVFHQTNEQITRIQLILPYFYYSARRKELCMAINSVGEFYRRFAAAIIAPGDEKEGSMMALASFGNPHRYSTYISSFIKLYDNGKYEIYDHEFFDYDNKKSWDQDYCFIDEEGKTLSYKNAEFQILADIAASAQFVFENLIFHIIEKSVDIVSDKNIKIILSGGCFLNASLNEKLNIKYPGQLFFQPASHDGGISIGCLAFGLFHSLNKNLIFNTNTCTWGFKPLPCDYKDIIQIKDRSKFLFNVVKLLRNGGVIGTCLSNAEFGPRALGNRSLLTDGTNTGIKNRINILKKRAGFRPFACSVLESDYKVYFNTVSESPFMLRAVPCIDEHAELLQELLHKDKTCRIQTVKRENGFIYDLLSEFKKQTGLSFILNTSLNLKGKPIAQDRQDAIDCFLKMDLDLIIFDDCYISKANISLDE